MPRVSFEEWMKALDFVLVQKCGLGVDDLPDQPYRDWYDDDVSLRTAVLRTLKDAEEG